MVDEFEIVIDSGKNVRRTSQQELCWGPGQDNVTAQRVEKMSRKAESSLGRLMNTGNLCWPYASSINSYM